MPESAGIVARSGADAQTVGEAVHSLARSFREAGLDTPQLDARILVAEAASVERSALLSNPERTLTAEAAARIRDYRARRLGREPVSRIIGKREFRGRMFAIGAGTLDPRPDTETVVEAALDLVRRGETRCGRRMRILDLGTGSGAILLTLLAELPEAVGVGTDTDPRALEIAARNANRHGLANRVQFQSADWLRGMTETFDMVVCNPPYIATAEIGALEPEVARFDPLQALDGGADGLAAYRAIISQVRGVLRPASWLLFEVGVGQADRVREICRQHGLAADGALWRCWKDLAGRPRCVATKTRP